MSEPAITTQQRRTFKGIDAAAFQHPLDREATAHLKRLQGFDVVVSKFIEFGIERLDYVIYNANSIRVSPNQFRRLHSMLRESCEILDIAEPALYVSKGDINAVTSGHRNPYIVLFSGLLDAMDDNEVMGVIAHELGHIKCGHVLYTVMARYLVDFIDYVGNVTFGLGGLLGMGLQAGFMTWRRRSELSADRAALLVLQDPRPCLSMLMKLAGYSERLADEMSVEEFLNQARTYGEEADRTLGERFYRILASTYQGTHPFAIERTKRLNEWIDTLEYENIVTKGIYTRQPEVAVDGRCPNPNCRAPVQPNYAFCGNCGARIVVAR